MLRDVVLQFISLVSGRIIKMVKTQGKEQRVPVRYVRKIMKLSIKFSKFFTLEHIARIIVQHFHQRNRK